MSTRTNYDTVFGSCRLRGPSRGALVLATPPDGVSGPGELRTIAAIAFLIFYSNYMVAPLIPVLARAFGVHSYDLKWLIPGFSMRDEGATLLYGILSDRFGRYPVLRILLGFAAASTMSLSFAGNAHQLVLLRHCPNCLNLPAGAICSFSFATGLLFNFYIFGNACGLLPGYRGVC